MTDKKQLQLLESVIYDWKQQDVYEMAQYLVSLSKLTDGKPVVINAYVPVEVGE